MNFRRLLKAASAPTAYATLVAAVLLIGNLAPHDWPLRSAAQAAATLHLARAAVRALRIRPGTGGRRAR